MPALIPRREIRPRPHAAQPVAREPRKTPNAPIKPIFLLVVIFESILKIIRLTNIPNRRLKIIRITKEVGFIVSLKPTEIVNKKFIVGKKPKFLKNDEMERHPAITTFNS